MSKLERSEVDARSLFVLVIVRNLSRRLFCSGRGVPLRSRIWEVYISENFEYANWCHLLEITERGITDEENIVVYEGIVGLLFAICVNTDVCMNGGPYLRPGLALSLGRSPSV
jgi:hypothetical protein